MSNYPKVLAAARNAERSQWHIGDALLLEVGTPRGSGRVSKADTDRMRECAAELAAAGHPLSQQRLAKLRRAAHEFAPDDRVVNFRQRKFYVGVEHALEAGTPTVLRTAVALAEENGKPLTKRYIAKVGKAQRKAQRKAAGRKVAPEPKAAEEQAEQTTSELGRHINVLDLTLLADEAAGKGRQLLKDYAAVGELTDDEREELVADIDDVLETWRMVADAVRNPVAADAERYLRAVADEGGA